MTAIDISDVHHGFGDLKVLDGVDLEVEAGTVLALLGPNGAGKTTLISIATTLLTADRGRVVVAGHDVHTHPDAVRRAITVTGQRTGLDSALTVRENLIMIGRLRGLTRSAATARAHSLVEQFDLGEVVSRPVRQLSGGTGRRLDLAVSLVRIPEIIFLDEPTTGLDTRSRSALWAIIGELAAAGVTILLTTQYLEEADRLAHRVAVLDAGRIVAVGDPAELKARVGEKVLEIRGADDTLVREVPVDGTVASVRGALATLSPGEADATVGWRSPTLDDVFLTLTAGSRR